MRRPVRRAHRRRPRSPSDSACRSRPPSSAAVIEAAAHARARRRRRRQRQDRDDGQPRRLAARERASSSVPEVLGLTFTRKAAGELAERIRERVAQLRRATASPSVVTADLFDGPDVATYNSFASAIYRDHAVLIGREPDAAVLSEASAWQLARRSSSARDDRLVELDNRVDAVTGAVLALSRALRERRPTADDVQAIRRRVPRASRPAARGAAQAHRRRTTFTERARRRRRARRLLLDLADALRRREARARPRRVLRPGRARARDLRRHPAGRRGASRARYRVVLLDEYQDTSRRADPAARDVCSRATPVMAVGDPNQSIYGWRGASAANLARFAERLRRPRARVPASTPLDELAQPDASLDAANASSSRSTRASRGAARARRRSPGAGRVDVPHRRETDRGGGRAVAALVRRRGSSPAGPASAARRGACSAAPSRTSASSPRRSARTGCRATCSASAGCCDQPVIADLVCALRVLHDPAAGSELVRLLAGARWRIGATRPRGARTASPRWLADRDLGSRRSTTRCGSGLRASIAADERRRSSTRSTSSLTAPDGHSRARARSARSASSRMRARRRAARSRCARRPASTCSTSSTSSQQELLLDIEVARERGAPLGCADLEAFDELLAGFADVDEHADARRLPRLARRGRAARRPRAAPEDPEPGTVQVLTDPRLEGSRVGRRRRPGWSTTSCRRAAHDEGLARVRRAAVRLPRRSRRTARAAMARRAEPGRVRRGGARPSPTRTASGTPTRSAGSPTSRSPARAATLLLTRLVLGVAEGARASRARSCASSRRPASSSSAACPRRPRPRRTRAARRASASAGRSIRSAVGARRVHAAADAVRAAARAPERRGHRPDARRASSACSSRSAGAGSRGPTLAAIPARVPASRFKDYVDDPPRSPSSCAGPCRSARTGRPASARCSTPGSSTAPRARATPRRSTTRGSTRPSRRATRRASRRRMPRTSGSRALQATFEASEWGGRTAVAVELEIHLPFDGHVFVCKLDAVYECRRTSWRPAASAPGRRLEDGQGAEGRARPRAQAAQLALYRLAYARWAGVDPDDGRRRVLLRGRRPGHPARAALRRGGVAPLVGVGRGVRGRRCPTR